MPEIPISRDQQAYIEALREELDEKVAYGHVREQDAVQYLIDHHREDGELDIEVQEVAAADENGAGEDADGEPESEDGAVNGDDAGSEESNEGSNAGGSDTDAEEGEAGSVDATVDALGNAGPGGGSGGDGGGASAEASGGETIGSAGGDMVDEMMNLMDAHGDAWEETDSSEGKYRVDLPDGGTQTVPTKDDVRALLFKHYR